MSLLNKKRIFAFSLLGLVLTELAVANPVNQLQLSSSITLSSVVDKVYQQQPQLLSEQAQLEQIQANKDYANALFSGQSVITLNHQNDVVGSGDGLQEWEGSLEFPLWLPQQQQLQRLLSDSMSAELPAYKAFVRLNASGSVRNAIWQVISNKVIAQQAYQAWQTAVTLQQNVELRIDAGEMPISEKLLANAHVFEMQQANLEQQAKLNYAINYYHVLTGESALPEHYEEQQASKQIIDATHPALALIDSSLQRLRDQQQLARFDGATHPNLSVGIRRERGNDDEQFNNSLGVGISFALDNDVYQRPAIAQAAKALADSEVERKQLQRQLSYALAEATHTLASKQQQLELVSKQAQATSDYLAVQQRSFELGEIDLVTLIRTQALSQQAQNQKRTLEVEIKKLIALRNQALGISL